MVLCASDDAHGSVEPVAVPADVPLGEKIQFEGYTGMRGGLSMRRASCCGGQLHGILLQAAVHHVLANRALCNAWQHRQTVASFCGDAVDNALPVVCRAGTPEEVLNPKKKIFERIAPDLVTDAAGTAMYKGVAFMTSKGPVTSTIVNAHVK